MPLDGFADKVKKLAFEGQSPLITKERAISGDDGQIANKPIGLFKNRRSNSYFKEAGAPSWNEESQELSNSRSVS